VTGAHVKTTCLELLHKSVDSTSVLCGVPNPWPLNHESDDLTITLYNFIALKDMYTLSSLSVWCHYDEYYNNNNHYYYYYYWYSY